MKQAVKKTNIPLRVTALLLAALLPFALFAAVVFLLPPAYDETFLGELAPKYATLNGTDEKKIIIIGGSSTAFGIDSAMLSEYTGEAVVNFGLYATLGTKLMLDLSLSGINEGDTVLLAPELDAQTLSLYFNSEAVWQTLDSDFSMLRDIDKDNYSDLAGGILGYAGNKMKYFLSGTKPQPTGIYRRDSFNAYGDVAAAREKNVMTLGYDPNRTINLTYELFDSDFLDYLNAYIARAEQRGAEVMYSFCPMNREALAKDTDDASLAAFYDYVCRNIACPVISGLDTAIMDSGYFYDTNFHLNDAGVTAHTAALIYDILRFRGVTGVPEIEIPPVPGSQGGADGPNNPDDPQNPDDPTPPVTETDPWEKYFITETYGNAVGIVGVTDEGKALTALELPRTVNGLTVRILSKDALKGCTKLTDLTIYENMTLLEDGCFAGADNLTKLHMRREIADDLEAGENLFTGARKDLYVYLYSDTSFFNFSSGYWWSVHSARLRQVK